MSSKAKDEDVDWKELKKTISGWRSDATATRDSAIQYTTARLAPSGVKKDSANWSRSLEEIDKKFASDDRDI